MDRRSFLKWLGIGVPAAAVAAVVVPKLGTSVPEKVTAKLGEWNNYFSDGDPELMDAIENWHSYSEVYPNLQTTFTLKPENALCYDKEFMQSLKGARLDQFKKLASREKIPVHMDVARNFFVYSDRS